MICRWCGNGVTFGVMLKTSKRNTMSGKQNDGHYWKKSISILCKEGIRITFCEDVAPYSYRTIGLMPRGPINYY